MTNVFFSLGAILAAVSVALGAFAAHGATNFMTEKQLDWMDKAARYNMYHALALFIVAWALTYFTARAELHWAGWSFVAGIALFSGSLYIMAFTNWRQLGMITPLGGVAFILGWILLAIAAWRG